MPEAKVGNSSRRRLKVSVFNQQLARDLNRFGKILAVYTVFAQRDQAWAALGSALISNLCAPSAFSATRRLSVFPKSSSPQRRGGRRDHAEKLKSIGHSPPAS